MVCSVEQHSDIYTMGSPFSHSPNFLYSPLTDNQTPFSLLLALRRYAYNMHIIQLTQTQFPPQETNAHLLWVGHKKNGEPNKLPQWVQANCGLFALHESSTLLGTNQTQITPAAHSAHATRIHLPMMEDPLRRSSCLLFSQYTCSRIPTRFLCTQPTTYNAIS